MLRDLADQETHNLFGPNEPRPLNAFLYWLRARGIIDEVVAPIQQPGGEWVFPFKNPKDKFNYDFKKDQCTTTFHGTTSNALYSILENECLLLATTPERRGLSAQAPEQVEVRNIFRHYVFRPEFRSCSSIYVRSCDRQKRQSSIQAQGPHCE